VSSSGVPSHAQTNAGTGRTGHTSWRTILFLILINLVLRGLWLLYMHPPQTSDFLYYYEHAVQLYRGQGFINHGHVSAFWPIGYPFFLSLIFHVTGPHVIAGLIVQALLSTATVVIIYLMTMAIGVGPKAAALAAIGYTILPSQIAWNSVLGTEELCLFLIALSLYLYIRYVRQSLWLVALSGLMMGFACDVREISALFPLALLVVELICNRKQWRRALLCVIVFTAGMSTGVAPVTIRNAIVMHHFILVSLNGGQNLWQGLHTNGGYYWSNNPKVNPILKGGSDEFLRDRIGKEVFLNYAVHHPWRIVVNGFKKMGDLYRYDQNVYYFFHAVHVPGWSGWPYRLVLSVSTWFYRLWMVIALTGIYAVLRNKHIHWHRLAVLTAFIVYNTALMSVFPAWDRFRMPMMPEWAVLFGIGAITLYYWMRTWCRKKIHGASGD
jgi:hypothetical protein